MLALFTAGIAGSPAAGRSLEAGALDVSAEGMLAAPTPLTSPQTIYLDVTLNQAPRGLLPFLEQGGRLQAPAATLRQLGFPVRGEAPVTLEAIAGLVVHYDAGMQMIALDVPLEQLQLPTTRLGAAGFDRPVASASPGLAINYDLYTSISDGQGNVALTTGARAFGLGPGSFSSDLVLRAWQQPGDGWQHESVRLDTRWDLDFPDSAVTLTVGDMQSGFLDWTRPVRMGGLRVGRNYGLQPYRVLTPTPSFLGQAVVPSSVELYVDGLRQYQGEVPVGPFQLATQPGITGNGTAQVVITDAFGRMQTLDFSFYGTHQLLAAGLTDWSVAAGRMRRGFGVRSFEYEDDTVASATLRHGVSNGMTLESHAEAGGGIANLGAGGLWLLGGMGVLSASYIASRAGDGLRGGQYAAGWNWNNRRINVNLATRRTHGHYRDLGSLQGGYAPSISDQATVGLNLERFGALSASYLRLDYLDMDRSRYLSVFWSRTFRQRWSAYVSVNQDLDDRDDISAYASLSISLGNTRQASATVQHSGGRTVATADVMKPVPGDGSGSGAGWRLQARSGDDGIGGLAEIGVLNQRGRYSAGASSQGGSTFGYASAAGSLVWMKGRMFAAREVPDAFAVVSTGWPDVPVMLENRPIGRTDDDGLLLVTPLLSWQRNRLSIDAMDLPPDVRAERLEALATPRQGAGIGVEFGLRRIRAVTVLLQDVHGRPLPVGARIEREGHPASVVGYDGMAWIEDLDAHNVLRVRSQEGSCEARFDLPPDGQRQLPALQCRPLPVMPPDRVPR